MFRFSYHSYRKNRISEYRTLRFRTADTACSSADECTVASPHTRRSGRTSPPHTARSWPPPPPSVSSVSATLAVISAASQWNGIQGRVSVAYLRGEVGWSAVVVAMVMY